MQTFDVKSSPFARDRQGGCLDAKLMPQCSSSSTVKTVELASGLKGRRGKIRARLLGCGGGHSCLLSQLGRSPSGGKEPLEWEGAAVAVQVHCGTPNPWKPPQKLPGGQFHYGWLETAVDVAGYMRSARRPDVASWWPPRCRGSRASLWSTADMYPAAAVLRIWRLAEWILRRPMKWQMCTPLRVPVLVATLVSVNHGLRCGRSRGWHKTWGLPSSVALLHCKGDFPVVCYHH